MIKFSNVSYDFGLLSIGSHADRTIKVTNNVMAVEEYKIQRDPLTNPLAHVFEMKPYSATVEPASEFIFNIRFTPVIPNTSSCDYFTISSSTGKTIKIYVRGKCIGPRVFCADKRLLVFLCMDLKKECQKSVALKNISDCSATYQFDVDETQSIFRLSKTYGSIPPHKSIKIKVTFEPPVPGRYIKRLYCLVRYQHPIMIEAIGLCAALESINIENINIVRYPQLEVIRSGYIAYLTDYLTVAEHIPPLTISENYLDFGQRDINNELNIPHTVSITNHTKDTIFFKWDLDRTGVFRMKPKSTMIDSGRSALFEAYFQPNKEGEVYSIELDGYAFWGDEPKNNFGDIIGDIHQLKIPIPVSIRMMGHTFSLYSPAWIPHCEILAQNVILPACIPQHPEYITFMIKSQGQMPLMFKFLPPKITNFTVKPMQGIIRHGFQSLVVQIFSENNEEAAYIERWGLQFNGSSKYEVIVDFQAYAEYPNIEVGIKNLIVFPATFPGCEQKIYVPIRNNTRHCLSYHFCRRFIPENYSVLEEEGVLMPNEIKTSLWKFIPHVQGEHLATMKCETQILHNGDKPVGRPVDVIVSGFGYSEYVELVSFPETIDFGMSPIGVEKKSFVHIFNFGSCQIYYTLKISHSAFYKGTVDVSLDPMSGTLKSSGNQEITVTINTKMTGFNIFSITYDVRKSPDSEVVINKLTEKAILTVQYTGVYPSLSVEDIRIRDGGPVFNKSLLWKMLNINRLNEELNKIQPGSMIEVPLLLPAAPINAPSITVSLFLKNNSGVSVEWQIKRFKNCDCDLVEVEKYKSFRHQDYDCLHRPMLQIYPLTNKLEPNESTIIHIATKYIIEGNWELKYIIYLPSERKIMLTLTIIVLNPDWPLPVCDSYSFQLFDTWIGDEDPVAQVFWFYNNGNEVTTYDIDVNPLVELKQSNYYVDIIKCMNPRGRILPKTNHPVIFGFNPIELKEYGVKCPMILGDHHRVDLHITGCGAVNYSSHIHKMRDKMPESRKFIVTDDVILLSVHHIVINPIPTFSSVDRIFFIENISNCLYDYQWYSYEIPGVLEAHVLPRTHYLPPFKSYVCKLVVKTFGQPCLITFPIICKLLNVTKRSEHGKSVLIRSSLLRALDGHFTIEHDSIIKPDCDVPIEPKPGAMYKVISVTCSIESRKTFEETVPLCKLIRILPDRESTITYEENNFDSELSNMSIVTSVLEIMIWEIVYSKWFDKLSEQLQKQETPYYSQISASSEERSQLNEQSFILPPKRLIASILRRMIYESLPEELNLGTPYAPITKPREAKRRRTRTLLSSASIDKLLERAKTEGKIRVPLGW